MLGGEQTALQYPRCLKDKNQLLTNRTYLMSVSADPVDVELARYSYSENSEKL